MDRVTNIQALERGLPDSEEQSQSASSRYPGGNRDTGATGEALGSS